MSQQDQNRIGSGKIAVVMGSQSDWPVMKHAVEQLEAFGVAYQAKVVSAHRTPDLLFEFHSPEGARKLDMGVPLAP